MPRRRPVKLFDTSGGVEPVKLPSNRKTQTKDGGHSEIYASKSTLYGLDRRGGILTAEEASKVPLRNKSGRLTRVPATVVEEASRRTQEESRKTRESQSSKTQRHLAGLAIVRDNVEDNPGPPDDYGYDYFDVPISDLAGFNSNEADDREDDEGNVVPDLQYIHILENLQGPHTTRKRYRHNQTRKQKKRSRQLKWDQQESVLADALLAWMAATTPKCVNDQSNCDVDAPPSVPLAGSPYFSLAEVSGLQWRRTEWPIADVHSALEEGYPAISLIASGVISNAPDTPNWGISIRTLESYRLIRLTKANYSIQAFVRAMCMNHGTTPSSSLQEKFSDALDLYLQLRRNIEHRIDMALGRDASDFHIKHFCPCCTHVVPGEAKLKHQFFYSNDGGASAKRWTGAGAASEGREYTHDYQIRLSAEAVDVFKDVVKRSKVTKKKKGARKRANDDRDESDTDDADSSDSEGGEPAGESTEVIDGEEYIVKNIQVDATGDFIDNDNDPNAECVRNWKAAAADAKKGMFDCFDETGSFVAICKHTFVIVFCDMIRSGELAKYPIAITNAIEAVFGDVSKAEGYDIWCAFVKTLAKAGIVIKGEGTTLAMHGYGHNRLCQLEYHPIYNIFLGLADFEQCERFFSAFNALASVIRHASKFHRHQWIHMFMKQHNADKTEKLGEFIYNNYRQALALIKELAPLVSDAKAKHQLSDEDIERMTQDELEYILALKQGETERENLNCLYLEALEKLWEADAEQEKYLMSRDTENAAVNTRTGNGKRKSKKSRAAIFAATELYHERVGELEVQLDIQERWTRTSDDYVAAAKYSRERTYHKAGNVLKAHIVQRLMELAKAHTPNINYKVRTNINKHIQTRSKTIKTAIRAFNKAARKLGKPVVTSKQVLSESFLEDFHILCDGASDIREKAWAQSGFRGLRDKYYKLAAARYEIKILHVEIDRLADWMRHENQQLATVITSLKQSGNPSLAMWVGRDLHEHERKCRVIKTWLAKAQALDDYTGTDLRYRTSAMDEQEGVLEDEEALFTGVDEIDRVVFNIDRLG